MFGCFVGFEDLQSTADKGCMIGLRFRCDPEVSTKNNGPAETGTLSHEATIRCTKAVLREKYSEYSAPS